MTASCFFGNRVSEKDSKLISKRDRKAYSIDLENISQPTSVSIVSPNTAQIQELTKLIKAEPLIQTPLASLPPSPVAQLQI